MAPDVPLRIAWVVYGSLDQVSGGYIYDRLVVDELRRLGDHVTVISLAAGEAALLPGEYDVVVGDELCFRELAPLFSALPKRVRRVLLVHHLSGWEHPEGAERGELLRLERLALEAADVCVATSRATADRLEHERFARDVDVAEPGADRFERPAAAGQEPCSARLRLLFIGNLLPRKRVLELVHAFADLPSEHAELVLVGAELEPDYARQVHAAVAEADVAARVRFLGALAAAGVAEQLSLADALVLPSALEGYGMVLSEALWCAVPVIAARVGAAEQLVNRTSAGLLYEPDDPSGLNATLACFVGDHELRARLRAAAWDAAALLPRWRDTAQQLRATLLRSL